MKKRTVMILLLCVVLGCVLAACNDIPDTEHNMSGFVGEKLYFKIDGKTVVYERCEAGVGTLTKKTILDSFEQQAEWENILWDVFSVEEYPDLSYVLVFSGTNSSWVYRVSGNVCRRVWDRYHPDYAEPVTSFSTRVPEFDNALIEYREDSKIYTDGEYLLGGTGYGCNSFYLSDLTGDGRPELCFGMNMGSGMISSQIEIIDYATKDKIFSLSDRGTHDYYLFLRNKVLCVKETEYSKQDAIRTGALAYSGSEISVVWDAEVNDNMDP